MKSENILSDAQSVPKKENIVEHRETIEVLRDKGYSWREIADFLVERGIKTDHTKVYRLLRKKGDKPVTVLTADTYKKILSEIEINANQMTMLEAHYKSINRSITYTELAISAGFENHQVANSEYGTLGKKIGEASDFQFAPSEKRPEKPFFSSSIGMKNLYSTGDFQLVMHHELSKAIKSLNWY